MPSIGAKHATRTIIATSGLLVTACATGQSSPVVTLNDAVHTRALIEEASSRTAKMQDQFAVEAEAARQAGNLSAAIQLAEQAIALDTNDAGARQTLATSYFAAGRFQSAAQAYADLLAMNPSAKTHKFGAALTALANGDNYQARGLLQQLESDAERQADVGLAYVLMGDLPKGKAILEAEIRSGTSSARTRQNLALAQALSGEWNAARVTAAMDLSPAQVDARVSEWAALAVSDDTAWRTAGLMQITPVATDAGRPVQLAWLPPAQDASVQFAAVTKTVEQDPGAQDPDAQHEDAVALVSAPVSVAVQPVVQAAPPAAERPTLVRASGALTVAPRAPEVKPEPAKPEIEAVEPKAAKTVAAVPTADAKDAVKLPEAGDGTWLVQLGAYDRLQWVTDNWQVLKTRNDFLTQYRPVRSRTEIDGRTYYRLSVGRFESADDAKSLCVALRAEGNNCFVRQGKFKA